MLFDVIFFTQVSSIVCEMRCMRPSLVPNAFFLSPAERL